MVLYDKNLGETEMTAGMDAGTMAALLGNQNKGGLLDGGGGLIGGLLLGTLLNNGGLGGFGAGANRGVGYGYGYPATPVTQAATSAVATDLLLQPLFENTNDRINTLACQVNQNAATDAMIDGFNSIDAGITSVNQNISGTTRDLLNSIANLSTAQATSAFTTLSSINGLGRDVTAQANQNALQQLNSFNQLNSSTMQGFNQANTTALQGFNEVGRDQAMATNQLIAGQNAQGYAMQQCCCEIKDTIKDDGAATRALISDLNVQNLTSQLNDAKMQISNLDQTNALISNNATQTSVILQHLASGRHPHIS